MLQSDFISVIFRSHLQTAGLISLYGPFLLWFGGVSRQNALLGAFSCRAIVVLCTWAWSNGVTTSQGFVCLSLFFHQRRDINAFQLPAPSPLQANVQCVGEVELLHLLYLHVEGRAGGTRLLWRLRMCTRGQDREGVFFGPLRPDT